MNVNHFSADKISNCQQLGLMVVNADGSICQSSGQLVNDHKTAKTIADMIDCIHLNETMNANDGQFTTMTIQFDDHSYWVHISPNKSTIVKCKLNPTLPLNT